MRSYGTLSNREDDLRLRKGIDGRPGRLGILPASHRQVSRKVFARWPRRFATCWPPFAARDVRVHTLEPDTAKALKRLKDGTDGIYVFRSERGGPLSPDIVEVICERAGREAGLGFRVHPHQLRHAAGFALAETGTDTRLIQDFLGHKDIKNTVVYTETSQRRLAAVRIR